MPCRLIGKTRDSGSRFPGSSPGGAAILIKGTLLFNFMSEAELIKRCIKKDKKAWDLFIQKYSRLVYWAIRKRLTASSFNSHESDIEDIFQEVLLTILKGKSLLQLKNPKYIPGWLAMVASNKAVDFMRKKIRLDKNIVFDISEFKDDSFEKELFSKDAVDTVKDIINTLSDKEKIIISLNLLEERTHKEIAQITGAPINTVSTIIARTKEKLKKELKKRGIAE